MTVVTRSWFGPCELCGDAGQLHKVNDDNGSLGLCEACRDIAVDPGYPTRTKLIGIIAKLQRRVAALEVENERAEDYAREQSEYD